MIERDIAEEPRDIKLLLPLICTALDITIEKVAACRSRRDHGTLMAQTKKLLDEPGQYSHISQFHKNAQKHLREWLIADVAQW